MTKLTLQEAVEKTKLITAEQRQRLRKLDINSPDYPEKVKKLTIDIAKTIGSDPCV